MLLLLYFVFLSFILNFSISSYLGNRTTNIITNIFMLFSLIQTIIILKHIIHNNISYTTIIYQLINIENLIVNISTYIDPLTIIMLFLVLVVSFCTHIYSLEYMLFDPYQNKFMSYLSLFTFFMLIMVTSNNLIQFFLGWEGIGICSFLLINFWYTRTQAIKASIMAVLVNKVGDITFLIALSVAFLLSSSSDISIITEVSSFLKNDYSMALQKSIAFLFIISALSKSAQIGLHIWLPEAMEGPTPVSSLIHAATLVTAGIFLILRFSNIYVYQLSSMVFILIIGSITTVFAASIGLFQNDIKKIIAYSTCSQLGYMFLSCGMNAFNYSIFHLMNHAFFKALLFLTSGYIIHSLMDEQDIRKYGSLILLNKYTYILILFSSLSLMGLPFLSGFYSKETIVFSMLNIYVTDINSNYLYEIIYIAQFFSYLTVFFTAIYSIKLLYFTFQSKYNGFKISLYSYHVSKYLTGIPLLILFFFSITSGYIFSDLLIGIGTPFWDNAIENTLRNEMMYINNKSLIDINYLYSAGHISHGFNNYITLYIIFISHLYFYFLPLKRQYITNRNYLLLSEILTNKYHFYQRLIFISFKNILTYSYQKMYLLIEKSLLEFFGISLLTRNIQYLQYKLFKKDTNFYKVTIFIKVLIILLYIF